MTDHDLALGAYLDRVGDGAANEPDWDDVLRRERRLARRGRLVRLGAPVSAVAAAVAAVALVLGGDGPSLVEKAQAAEITGTPPAGQVSHVRDAYRDASGHVFIAYDSWLAADGSWCRSVLEEPVTDYTLCVAANRSRWAYFASSREILHAPAPAPGTNDTAATTAGVVASEHDLLETFALGISREDGSRTLDGKSYPALATTNGDTVLVDPDSGSAVAWIPSPAAFGRPVVVLRTQETVAAAAAADRLSLTALHPAAPVRDVSGAALDQALAAQYPNG